MRTEMEGRLAALRAEFESGQKMLADLQAREAQLRETMLRISGAIQVLEELLAASPAAQTGANGASPAQSVPQAATPAG